MKNLIIHAGYGEGHKRAAQALEGLAGAQCVDMLDFCSPAIKKSTVSAYLKMTRGEGLFWNLLFTASRNFFFRKSCDFINFFIFRKFFKFIEDARPQNVIVTHPFALPFLAVLKRKLGFKVFVVVTDMRVHPWWVNKEVDIYFAAVPETAADLMRLGIKKERIRCGFVSLRTPFWQNVDRKELCAKNGVDDRPGILFVSSVQGRFPFLKELLPELVKKYNIFIIYGKNIELKNYLDGIKLPNLKYFDFCENIYDLFALSFVIVTKPGGLTSFEGLAQRKFFLFTHFIPGQEEANMKLLEKYGLGYYARSKEDFLHYVDEFAKKNNTTFKYPLKVEDIRPVLERMIG